jgi:hypothetical protein
MEGVRSALVNLNLGSKKTNIGESPWPMSETVPDVTHPSHFSYGQASVRHSRTKHVQIERRNMRTP